MTSLRPTKGLAPYDPRTVSMLSFVAATPKFRDGSDTPRDYLERCLETITVREPEVQAFAAIDPDAARHAADESTARYKAGAPLSVVDGMPVAIKDLFDTVDLPTQKGNPFFKGWNAGRDAAHVHALRKGGAIILAKGHTTEFGAGAPAPTRNPYDLSRTPGGSSSGPAAAVAAQMLPFASASHGRGSGIRPASYCGLYALKPTYGAINRGGCDNGAYATGHMCTYAGTLEDCWVITHFLGRTAGPDPGCYGLYGPAPLPPAELPRRLIRLGMAGWAETDEASKSAFEECLRRLAAAGVAILGADDDPRIAAYETTLQDMTALYQGIALYDYRYPLASYRDRDASLMDERILKGLERADGYTLDDYRTALDRQARFKAQHQALAALADGFITLSSLGPASVGMDSGSAIYNESSSVLGVPTYTLPLLAVGGMPLGVQLQGFCDGDALLTAYAGGIAATVLGASA
ncbi:MAG: amidase [Proteobacteria bacterium]|nr:amidase [Pseudomonadota bacterium]